MNSGLPRIPECSLRARLLTGVRVFLALVLLAMHVGSSFAQSPGAIRWRFELNGYGYSAPAVAPDGTLYVGSAGGFSSGSVYAVHPDGTLKWKLDTGAVIAAPAIGADGTIYIGLAAGWPNFRFLAISPEGATKWVFDPRGDVQSSAAIAADGTIYFTATVGTASGAVVKFYALKQDGEPKWVLDLLGGALGSPAIGADGTIYIGTYAISPDGSIKWVFKSLEASPAVGADGTIYITHVNVLFAVNPDGSEKWSVRLADKSVDPSMSPAIGTDGTIYVSTRGDPQSGPSSKLFAVDPGGRIKWVHVDELGVSGSPAISSDGTIFVGSKAISADGSFVWRASVPAVNSSAAVGADGTLYFSTSYVEIGAPTGSSKKGHLYAVHSTSGALARSPWPMFRHDLKHTGRVGNTSLQVFPRTGGDTGEVTVQIWGAGLSGVSSVVLRRAGEPDTVGSRIVLEERAGSSLIRATFDLAGKSRGAWDVVVTTPSGTILTIPEGFTVEEGTGAKLWVDLVGRGVIRPGVTQTYWLSVGNSGNVDAPIGHVFLWTSEGSISARLGDAPEFTLLDRDNAYHLMIVNLPSSSQMAPVPLRITAQGSFEFAASIRDDVSGMADLRRRVRDSLGIGDIGRASLACAANTYPDYYAPDVCAPAGYVYLFRIDHSFGFQHGLSLGNCEIRWSGPSAPGHPDFKGVQDVYLRDVAHQKTAFGILVPLGAWRPAWDWGLGKSDDELRSTVIAATSDLKGVPFDNPTSYSKDPRCTGCTGTISCADFVITSLRRLGYTDWPSGDTFDIHAEIGLRNCSKSFTWWDAVFFGPPKITPDRRIRVLRVAAVDPNEKVGNSGVGEQRFLAGDRPLRYVVYFENLKEATAPAQEVVVTDQLETAEVDLSTFSLGPIAFGAKQVLPPLRSQDLSTEVDLRPTKNLIVGITAHLGQNTGVVTWRFRSLDPLTRQPPEDPLTGFLPPNKNPPEGEGSIQFTVTPKAGLLTGTKVRNKASITFDANAPIDTEEWLNALDNDNPASHVASLPTTVNSASFPVTWSGTDVGVGMKDYTVYVAEDGGPFGPWLQNTMETSGTYIGKPGSTYAFYSRARDLTGNFEDAPSSPDAVTSVTQPNVPPVANAGANQTVRYGSVVKLNGSESTDPDNGPSSLSYAWAQTAGPPASLSGSTLPNPTFVPNATGTYGFSLTVSDGAATSAPSSVSIAVPKLGDIDGNGDIDQKDLRLVFGARNRLANGPNDLRDLDSDGMITASDASELLVLWYKQLAERRRH